VGEAVSLGSAVTEVASAIVPRGSSGAKEVPVDDSARRPVSRGAVLLAVVSLDGARRRDRAVRDQIPQAQMANPNAARAAT